MVWPPEPPKRKVRSNQMQLQMLVDYMSKHRRFAKGIDGNRGPLGMKKVLKQWDNLRIILSQYGPKKSVEQWKHTWRDLKKKARDEAMRRMDQTATSTSDPPYEKKSDMNAKILAILQDKCLEDQSAESDVEVSDEDTDPVLGEEPGNNDRLHIEVVVEQEPGQDDANLKTEMINSSSSALSIKIAIIPEGFPNKQFKGDGWTAFTPIMFTKLEEASELPKVDVEGIVAGAIHISCKSESDVEWVCSNFNGEVIDGRKVKVVNARDLPKPVKMAWQTRNYVITDNSRVLRLMQRAHPELRTTGWKVEEIIVEEGLIRRIVLMDTISADYIKSMGYKLNNGMCTDDFEVLDKSLEEDGASSSYNCNESRNLDKSVRQRCIPEPSIKRETRTPSPIIQVWLEPESPGLLTVGAKSHQNVQPLQQVNVLAMELSPEAQFMSKSKPNKQTTRARNTDS